MSKSCKAAERGDRAGFTLLEMLIALLVAGLFLSVFARAVAGGWTSTRTPMDVVSAVVLANAVAAGAPTEAFQEARRRGFTIERVNQSVAIVVERSNLAPAPPDAQPPPPERHSTPASMQLALPKALMAAKPNPVLRGVSIVVRTPLGRRIRFDSIVSSNAQ